MYRATTPTHTFTLPIETSSCDVILVTYNQDKTKLVKRYQDGTASSGMHLDGKKIVIVLTQEETLKFLEGFAGVQVRLLLNDGTVRASKKFSIRVEEVNNEEVLQ